MKLTIEVQVEGDVNPDVLRLRALDAVTEVALEQHPERFIVHSFNPDGTQDVRSWPRT
jgi:hypothetical protein